MRKIIIGANYIITNYINEFVKIVHLRYIFNYLLLKLT